MVLKIVVLVFAGMIALTSTPVIGAASNAANTAQFKKADRNKDGVLNRGEFARFIRAMAKLGSRDAKKVIRWNAYNTGFSRADGNKNGKITLNELKRFK